MHGYISIIYLHDDLSYLNAAIDLVIATSEYYNINLEQQIQDKLAYNRTRPIKHGGKRL